MIRLLGTLALALALPVTASGVTLVFNADLSGANENPPVPSSGTGTALVSVDTDAHTISVDLTWSDLTGTTTMAHIHCCVDPPGNVGVATFPGTFPGFPVGVTSGSYLGDWDLSDPASYTADFLAASGGTAAGAEAALIAGLEGGRAYVNIHTSFAGGGEIRGFLVPEPAPGALLASGLAALALCRLRRARGREAGRGLA